MPKCDLNVSRDVRPEEQTYFLERLRTVVRHTTFRRAVDGKLDFDNEGWRDDVVLDLIGRYGDGIKKEAQTIVNQLNVTARDVSGYSRKDLAAGTRYLRSVAGRQAKFAQERVSLRLKTMAMEHIGQKVENGTYDANQLKTYKTEFLKALKAQFPGIPDSFINKSFNEAFSQLKRERIDIKPGAEAKLVQIRPATANLIRQSYRVGGKESDWIHEIVDGQGRVVARVTGSPAFGEARRAAYEHEMRGETPGHLSHADLQSLLNWKNPVSYGLFLKRPQWIDMMESVNPDMVYKKTYADGSTRNTSVLRERMEEFREASDRHKRRMTELKKKVERLMPDELTAKRIGYHLAMRQKGGKEALSVMKVTPEVKAKLNPREMKLVDEVRNVYDQIYAEVNDLRVRMGMDPIDYVTNYMTFNRVFEEGMEGEHVMFRNKAAVVDSINERTMFSEKMLAGLRDKGYTERSARELGIELDVSKNLMNYADHMWRFVEMAPVAQRINGMISTLGPRNVVDMGEFSRLAGADKFKLNHEMAMELKDWSNNALGVNNKPVTEAERNFIRAVNWGRKNLALSMILGNMRTLMLQPTAAVLAIPKVGGMKNLVKATAEWLADRDAFRTTWRAESKVLFARTAENYARQTFSYRGEVMPFDKFIDKHMPALKDLEVMKDKFGAWVMERTVLAADAMTATVVYRAAKIHAEEMGMTGEAAIKYADDVVIRTQGSAEAIDAARIQMSSYGRAISTFGNFSMSMYNFLIRDVLGKGLNKSRHEVVADVAHLMVGMALVNTLFEYLTPWEAPFPTPIMSFIRKMEDTGGDVVSSSGASLLEVAEILPLVGNMKYSSTLGGPLFDVTNATLKAFSSANWKRAATGTAKLAGVPAAAQFEKFYNYYEDGQLDPLSFIYQHLPVDRVTAVDWLTDSQR